MIKTLITAALALCFATQASAWKDWDVFKQVSMDGARVVDFSDDRQITTSEGQSYAMFFALVANDRERFAQMAKWTEENLADGNLGKTLPAWLWGKKAPDWKVLDSNNACDSDMWIAYCLLEAGRLWNEPAYTQKGHELLALIKTQVREIPSVGKVLLPGRFGFDQKETYKLNPSYYPLFLLRRFALEDPSWNEVFDGCLRSMLVSAPAGVAPDWPIFDKSGRLMQPTTEDDTYGSYNAIRVYLWAGMMSPKDPARKVLKDHFQPMVRLTEQLNLPPEQVNVRTLAFNRAGWDYFGGCVLPIMDPGKQADFIATLLLNTLPARDTYYRNVLTLFTVGYLKKLFAFDEHGRVVLPKAGGAQ